MRVAAALIREQLLSVLRAWGMSEAHGATTAEMMLETDLRGVDSHGISMLPTYDRELRAGRLNMRAQFSSRRCARTQKPSDPHNLGHFFMAIDPRAFRGAGEFEDDLDQVIDTLRAARRADPAQPVLVAGDPEMATRAERLRDGVPVPDDLLVQLRAVAAGAGVPFVLAR